MTRISAFIASSAVDMTHASKMRSTCACAIAYPKTSGSRGEEVLGSLKPPQPLARGGVALPDLHAQPARRRRGKDLEEGGHRLPHAARPLNLDASHLERESGEAHRHPVVVVRRHCRVAEGGGGGRGDGESVRRNLLLDARLALAQLVPQCRHTLALLLAQHAERSEGVRLRGERRDGDRRHHRVAQIRRRVPRNDTRRQLRSLGRIGRRAAVAVAAVQELRQVAQRAEPARGEDVDEELRRPEREKEGRPAQRPPRRRGEAHELKADAQLAREGGVEHTQGEERRRPAAPPEQVGERRLLRRRFGRGVEVEHVEE
mmetsp:Transcript_14837/g.44576  ORF Transcript_14837/g.44576 Transcript_14837/m.44576 type:complete len:316 (-) Transcript_14837:802-1749(-)